MTSAGSLSTRSPRYVGARMRPAEVHPVKVFRAADHDIALRFVARRRGRNRVPEDLTAVVLVHARRSQSGLRRRNQDLMSA